MLKDLNNTIALISLIVAIFSLFITLLIHKSSINHNELSKIRDGLINRLENLCDLDAFKNNNISNNEKELIFEMHLRVIELDIKKYSSLIKHREKEDLTKLLQELMILDINNESSSTLRKHCYYLLSKVDKDYYYEIENLTFSKRIKLFYYEIKGLFYSLCCIYMIYKFLSYLDPI